MCCKSKPVTDEEGSTIIYTEYADRKCTDTIFCILFLVFWLVMVIIAGVGIGAGNPDRLLYGKDWEGNVCGSTTNGVDKTATKFVYYPRIVEDVVAYTASGGFATDPLGVPLFGLCMSACPKQGDTTCTADGRTALTAVATKMEADGDARFAQATAKEKDQMALTEVNTVSGYHKHGTNAKTVKGQCWLVPLPSTDYFYRCMWQKDGLQVVNRTCVSPSSLNGIDMDKYESGTKTEQELAAACITTTTKDTKTTTGQAQSNPLLDQMFNAAGTFGRYFGDVKKASTVIWVCGAGLGVLLGLFFLVVMRKAAGFMVWFTIVSVIIILILGTFYSYFKAGIITSDDVAAAASSANAATGGVTTISEEPAGVAEATTGSLQTRWKYFSYFMTVLTLVIIILTAAWYKKIKICIAVIKEAAAAVQAMPLLLLTPLVTTIFVIILVVYFLLVGAFLASAEEIKSSTIASAAANSANAISSSVGGKSLLCPVNETTGEVNATGGCASMLAVTDPNQAGSLNNILLAIHFFGFLWTNQFIAGISTMTIAGAVSQWYFTKDKSELPPSMIKTSIKTIFRYHLGSIAFGSLIIAIVQFLRAVLEYANKKSEKAQKKNIVLKAIFCCLRCCLWCFEKCLKFITSYGYILIAMQGISFCKACRQVIGLIMGNPVQIGLVNTITNFMFILSKLAIVGACGFIAFQWLDNDASFGKGGANQLEGFSLPILLVMVIALAIATMFINVFSLGVDTILLCFLIDREKNDGETKPYYMSPNLLKAIGASTKKNKALTGAKSDSDDEAEAEAAKPAATPAAPAAGGAGGGGDGGGDLL